MVPWEKIVYTKTNEPHKKQKKVPRHNLKSVKQALKPHDNCSGINGFVPLINKNFSAQAISVLHTLSQYLQYQGTHNALH